MLRKLALGIISGLMVASAAAQQTYAQHTTVIRAAMLTIDSDNSSGIPNNWAPHALYNLDMDSKIKPNGWILDNPDHPGSTTIASPLSKQDSSYWSVSLDSLNDKQISDFDVLILAAHGPIELNTVECERLRRFMDAGGVLWIDLNSSSKLAQNTSGGANDDLINGFPLPFKFATGAFSIYANYLHPLMSYPNAITYGDLVNMQGPNPNNNGITSIASSDLPSSIQAFEASIPGDSEKLQYIVGGESNQFLSIGAVGDGYEVITTQDVLTTINEGGTGSANTGTVALAPVTTAATNSAARLAFNIMSLASQYGQVQRGSHRLGGTFVDIGAPLLEEFTDSGVNSYATTGTYQYSPPVAYKGMVVIVSGSQVLVYDGHPAESLSGNGSADDGLTDFSNGPPGGYDLIWKSEALTGPISPPTCIEVPYNNGSTVVPMDQVWVVDGSGNLQGFNLFSHFSGSGLNSVAPDFTVNAPSSTGSPVVDSSVPAPGPYAPAYHDGILFVADAVANTSGGSPANVGRVWMANPSKGTALLSGNGGSEWQIGGNAQQSLREPSGSPTVGYIPIADGSGGMDRVIYFPFRATGGGSVLNQTAGIGSLWLGAKGESEPSGNVTVSGSSLTITTRCGQQIFIPASGDDAITQSLGPKLTVIDSSGNPLPQSTMENIFGSSSYPSNGSYGQIIYTLSNPGLWSSSYSVRIDYTIDMGQPAATTLSGVGGNALRGVVMFPDDQSLGTPRRVLNNVALGANGYIYAVLSSQDPSGSTPEGDGGSYWCLQEYGRGSFNVLSRWDLYDEYTQVLDAGNTAAATATVLPTVSNQDPLLQLFPILGSSSPMYSGQLQHLTFTSGPVVSGGVAYVLGQGVTNQGVPDTILFAFNANPPTPTISLTEPIPPGGAIQQADVTASSTRATPNMIVTFPPPPANGTNPNVINMGSLSTQLNGYLSPTLSQSQPVVIQSTGSTNTLVYPDSTGSTWTPLEWYTVLTGCGLTTSGQAYGTPLVTGNSVFIPTSSALPSLLNNNSFTGGTPSFSGIIYGIDTTIAPNDPALVSDQHAWQKQLVSLTAPPGQALNINNLYPNPDFLWPQFTGVSNFTDLQTRVNQATLPTTSGSSSFAFGAIAANGRLFAWDGTGLFGFERANFIVADSGRVAKFDSAGNPIWSTDQTISTGPSDIGTAGKVHPLAHPTRAYTLNNGQIMVADPGNNRIALLDQSGRETRSFDSFTVDPGNLPDGYTAGEPLTFSSPRDVLGFTAIVSNTVTAGSNPFTNPAPTGYEYWIHYLIADTGNRRVLDIVDRYVWDNTNQVVGAPIALGVLYRHSPASVSGGKFAYTCITRQYDPAIASDARLSGQNGYVDILGIGNTNPASYTNQPSTLTTSGLREGFVLWCESNTPTPVTLSSSAAGLTTATPLVNTVSYGASGTTGPNTLFVPTSGSELNGTFSAQSVDLSKINHPIGDLNSITARYFTGPSGLGLYVLFTDTSGVYEVNSSDLLSPTSWTTDWMLPRSLPVPANGSTPAFDSPVYSIMRMNGSNQPTNSNPLDFRPTYAERLADGDILVVNGYVGRYRKNSSDPDAPFQGEILELDPSTYSLNSPNLGFTTSGAALIKYALPPITGTRGIVAPLFAHRS